MTIEEWLALLKKTLSSARDERIDKRGYLWLTIDRDEIIKAAEFIKDHFKDENIILDQFFGTDLPDSEEMECYYTWWHIDHGLFFTLRYTIPYSDLKIPSITPIWWAANWHEREIWEMLGVDVEGHPELEQLLLPDELMGKYPMRKSFKLISQE